MGSKEPCKGGVLPVLCRTEQQANVNTTANRRRWKWVDYARLARFDDGDVSTYFPFEKANSIIFRKKENFSPFCVAAYPKKADRVEGASMMIFYKTPFHDRQKMAPTDRGAICGKLRLSSVSEKSALNGFLPSCVCVLSAAIKRPNLSNKSATCLIIITR